MRASETYRRARRSAWAVTRSAMPWRQWNDALHGGDGFSVGHKNARAHSTILGRSKYMLHGRAA